MGARRTIARVTATAAVIVALIGGGAAAASATETKVEGGTWKYGFREYSSTPYIYSEYLHNTRTHKASTIRYDGTLKSSGWVQKGSWAKAPEQASNWRTDLNHWYYNVQ